jgi:hypothetical protein
MNNNYDLDEHKNNSFIQKVTPQKKRLRQLKFSIYSRTFENKNNSEICDYIIIITDRFDMKKIIKGNINMKNKEYCELYCILEGIKYIYNSVEQDYKKYIIIKMLSNNIFITNLLREWINIWSENNFINCNLPSDILYIIKDIYKYIIQFKTDIFWVTKTTDKITWLLYSKNSIEEF